MTLPDNAFAQLTAPPVADNGPTNVAALRTLAINAFRLTGQANIAAGLRQHARTPFLPLATLGLA